jgi:phosphoribosylaminoimidazole-succinocarboxamide synthase
MGLENLALFETHTLPIRHVGNVHNGKVRSVYWLSPEDSRRLVETNGFQVAPDALLGLMIISDRISAFNVNWQAMEGLSGVPGKGAALNAISQYWFGRFDGEDLAGNHILDVPHPLVWIVQKAEPILVEGVARQYITGSMWRDYEAGAREFCGIKLPEGLKKNQRLSELLLTPTTKGVLKGILGVPEKDDTPISRDQILANYAAFGFRVREDVDTYETLLRSGFDLIARDLADVGQIFVDTKFEFGYVPNQNGGLKMIYMDEVGTPDSSRLWDTEQYASGRVVENSKEGFRQFLLDKSGISRRLLLDDSDDGKAEKKRIASSYRVPVDEFMKVSRTYTQIAEKITGVPVPEIRDARGEILESLTPYGLVA